MPVKRFYAVADNTITNSFSDDLVTRSTSANAGKSDILEVYSIFGRTSVESIEKSRVLIQFDLEDLSLANQPSGAKYYLKLFNAKHAESLPSDFTLSVKPISSAWREGDGLDLINYSDEDESNWLAKDPTKISQVLSLQLNSQNLADYANQSFSVYDGTDARFNFFFKTANEDSSQISLGTDIEVDLTGQAVTISEQIETSINETNVFAASRDGNTIEIANIIPGQASAPVVSVFANEQVAPSFTINTVGSDHTPWNIPGGDYSEVLDAQAQQLVFEQQFLSGDEDLEIEVTQIIQQWLSVDPGSLSNNGLGVMLRSDFEDGSKAKSFYTKRFFARDSEYFLRRPHIEMRYDNCIKDDSGKLRTASPHKSDAANTMRVYYQNVERGVPTDLESAPNFTLTTDKSLSDKVTLVPNANSNSTIDTPNSDHTVNAYVEFAVNNTSAAQSRGFSSSVIIVTHTDDASGEVTDFEFTSRFHNWSVPARSNQTYPVNVSNTLENRTAAATSIATEMNEYPGFDTLFVAVASGESVRIYSKVPGDAGQTSSVSLFKVSDLATSFLTFARTDAHPVDSFDPFVPDDPDQEGDQSSGNAFDSLIQLNDAGYAAFVAASSLQAQLTGALALDENNRTYDRTIRNFRGNVGVTATSISSDAVTGSAGLYVAEFKIANNIVVDTLYKKWWVGNNEVTGLLSGHGGNQPVNVKQWHAPDEYGQSSGYTLAVKNLQSSYSAKDTVRIRIGARLKSLPPNVVSKNTGNVTLSCLENSHYRLFRVSDKFEVVPYDLVDQSTRLSYDGESNFLDLDMSILEPGYSYALQILIIEGEKQIQSDKVFKFRVEK